MNPVDYVSLEVMEAAKCIIGIFVMIIFGRILNILEKIEKKL